MKVGTGSFHLTDGMNRPKSECKDRAEPSPFCSLWDRQDSAPKYHQFGEFSAVEVYQANVTSHILGTNYKSTYYVSIPRVPYLTSPYLTLPYSMPPLLQLCEAKPITLQAAKPGWWVENSRETVGTLLHTLL